MKCITVRSPLLHLAVGTAGVVDKASVAAHAVPVNHEPAVQVQAIVVRVTRVPCCHAFLEKRNISASSNVISSLRQEEETESVHNYN